MEEVCYICLAMEAIAYCIPPELVRRHTLYQRCVNGPVLNSEREEAPKHRSCCLLALA